MTRSQKIDAIMATIAIIIIAYMFTIPAHAVSLYSKDGKYLGELNANRYDPNSVSNPYGRYGNPYSPDSINNPYGRYGNPYSQESVNNPYVTGNRVLIDNDGEE
jgi:hypothetical protein